MRGSVFIGLISTMVMHVAQADFRIPITRGKDRLMVLESVHDTIQARVDIIRNAKRTIDLQYFAIDSDFISVSSMALLKEALKQSPELKVRIMVDSLNNKMTRELMAAFLDNLLPLEKTRIEIREFNQFSLLNPFCYTRRMHDKALIVDDQFLIVGDRNVSNGYFNGDLINKRSNLLSSVLSQKGLPIYQGVDALVYGGVAPKNAAKYFQDRWDSADVKPVRLYDFNRDTLDLSYCHLRSGEGADPSCYTRLDENIKATKHQMRLLEAAMSKSKKEKLVSFDNSLSWFAEGIDVDGIEYIHDEVTEKSICSGKTENNMGAQLYKAIDEKTKSDLTILTPYLVITSEMETLIKKLVARGVKINFITNSKISNDVSSAHAGYLQTRDKLLNQGVTIYEYERLDDAVSTIHTLHAKVVIMDGQGRQDDSTIFIGSYNWDGRSQNINSEVGILFGLHSQINAPAVQLANRIQSILESSTKVTFDKNSNQIVTVKYDDLKNKTIKDMIAKREKNVKVMQRLLRIQFFGPLLEGQL